MLCDNCDLFYEEATLVLQPKGLNNNPYSASFQQANDSYARIMFNFSYDELTQEDVKELTPSDLKELNQIIYEDVKREFDCIADIIPTSGQLKWYLLCKKKHIRISNIGRRITIIRGNIYNPNYANYKKWLEEEQGYCCL